jgi:fatty acid CoA ligase FadD28
VEEDRTEQLVAIVEVKARADSDEAVEKLLDLKRDVTSAISQSHGLSAADLVLVPRGAIPITTSGKIRRAACVERYRNKQFTRLDDQLAAPRAESA